MTKPRGRDLGLPFPGETGPNNAITDVPGVEVGYRTLIEGNGPLMQGHGPVRTGVTAILPLGRTPEPQPVWAGMYALNGNGEMTGTHWIHDGGYFVGPICITNSHSVGIVHHAATRWMIQTYADAWQAEHLWAMPVVAETYDGMLNDINGQHVTEADALTALEAAAPALAGGDAGGVEMSGDGLRRSHPRRLGGLNFDDEVPHERLDVLSPLRHSVDSSELILYVWQDNCTHPRVSASASV
ncbi:MAG: hypothetical protein E2O54_12800, partial [Gammaproteobacteria bacterium]